MLLKRRRSVRAAQQFADGAIGAASFAVAAVLWSSQNGWGGVTLGLSGASADLMRLGGLAGLFAPLALQRCGAYTNPQRGVLSLGPRALLPGTLLCVCLLLASSFALGIRGLSVSLAGLYALIQLPALVALRMIGRGLLRAVRSVGYRAGAFVMVGTAPQAQEAARKLAAQSGWTLRNRGYFDDEPRFEDVEFLGQSYLGKTKELPNLLSHELIDEVVVALPRAQLVSESTAEIVALCELVGVDVTFTSDLFPTTRMQPQLHDLMGVTGFSLANYPHRRLGALAVKRAMDVVGSLLGILIMFPMCLLVALAIKLDSRGPVLFVQRRCGLRGRAFPFLKFRTMYADAEERLEGLLEDNEVLGPVFKIRNDPRVTRLGRVLRRYSIDELPQLLNVLVGQMSLVGPRPPIPNEVGHYELVERRRLSVRPGLTCLWQVSGRSLIPFEEWVRLDLEYIDKWSLWLDLRILIRTVPAVLSTVGAS